MLFFFLLFSIFGFSVQKNCSPLRRETWIGRKNHSAVLSSSSTTYGSQTHKSGQQKRFPFPTVSERWQLICIFAKPVQVSGRDYNKCTLRYVITGKEKKKEYKGRRSRENNKYVCYVSFVLYTDVGKWESGKNNRLRCEAGQRGRGWGWEAHRLNQARWYSQLRCCNLGRHSALALQLDLITIKRLLSTIFQIRALVVFRKSMLQ